MITSDLALTSEVEFEAGHIWSIVGAISKSVQAELRASIDEDDQDNITFLRQQLATYYPPVFVACDAIEQVYVQANSMLDAQARRLVAVAKASVATETKREAEDQVKIKRAGKRTKVDETRKPAGFDAYNIREEDRQKAFAQYYSKRDLWSPDEYNADWLKKYVIPGSKIAPSQVLCQYDLYKTIYHCTGKWGMETLIDILTEAGHQAIGIRDETQKFEDMLRYKVVTSEPFEP